MTDLIGGQAQVVFATTGSSLHTSRPARCARSRRRPTTLCAARRAAAGEVLPGFGPVAGAGSARRKERLPEIVTLLNKEVNGAIADSRIKQRIASLGVALPGSPEDYGRTIAADTDKWAKVVQFSGAHAN